MKDIKITSNDEISEEDLAEFQAEIKKLMGDELQPTQSQKTDMVFAVDPMILSEEELIPLMTTKEFKEGFEYGLRLAGIYTACASFGMDLGTANDIALTEHTKFVNIETQKIINEGYRIQAIKAEKNSL